jgi:hypothetical protein
LVAKETTLQLLWGFCQTTNGLLLTSHNFDKWSDFLNSFNILSKPVVNMTDYFLSEKKTKHWFLILCLQLEDWWLKYAYLVDRSPLPIGTNFGGIWLSPTNQMLLRAVHGLKPDECQSLRAKTMATFLRRILQWEMSWHCSNTRKH